MSETLLQAAAARRRRVLLLRAAASERVCFIPVPKPEYYSLRQGKEERGREGGSREEREREAAGRREAGSSEGRRERAEELGKRRESAERSSASGVEAREGGGPPAPGPGQRAAPPPSSARARGGACIVRGCEERGCGLGPPRAQDTVAGGRGAARWVRRGPE